MSYMAIPLAIFFGLAMAVILSPFLAVLKNRGQYFLTGIFLILNMLPASAELVSFEQYNHDTIFLLKWIDHDPYLKMASLSGKHFGCNGMEPSTAIPDLVKSINNKDMPAVSYVPVVKDIVNDKDMLFYFYLTHWGDQDLSLLGDMWTAVFVSENWVVFRRNY